MKKTILGMTAALAIGTGCIGAGLGALGGQVIGGNTKSTLIGAGLGAAAQKLLEQEQRVKKLEEENKRKKE